MQIDAARTANELISAVSMAMDIEDGVKLYHGWRVAIIATHLAEAADQADTLESFYGGVLHDVGAVGLPQHVVNYLGTEVRTAGDKTHVLAPGFISHSLLSAEIVSSLPGVSGAARAVLDHHEDWNGHGFPRALRQDEIGLDAQILHAADTADLLLRSEPAPDLDEATDRIAALDRASFQPDVTELLVEQLRAGLYEKLLDPADLDDLFEATRADVGPIPVEPGTDAIGVTLDILARVVDNKHAYTVGHSRRVARYALLIGIAMGLEHDDLTLLKWAALIHDVGKLSCPTGMLDKPAELSPEEYETMKFHASYTFDIVSTITDLRPVAIVASSHHERWDGGGYPLGWAREHIPLGSRIIAVADAFDAITSHRPYRTTSDIDMACDEIRRSAGTQFDPQVARTALPVLRNLGAAIGIGGPTA